MISRKTFTYSSFTLATVIVAPLALHSVLADVIQDATAAKIITAILMAFAIGSLATIAVIYLGAQLKGTVSAAAKTLPPHQYIFNPPAPDHPTLTEHPAETPFQPRVLVENGIARVLDDPLKDKPSLVEWVEFDPAKGYLVAHTIDLNTLRRFARLHTPRRAEWSGKSTTYTTCLKFFSHVHWVQPTDGKGVGWVAPYTKLHRRLAYLGDPTTLTPPHPQLSTQHTPNRFP